jgi:sortase A
MEAKFQVSDQDWSPFANEPPPPRRPSPGPAAGAAPNAGTPPRPAAAPNPGTPPRPAASGTPPRPAVPNPGTPPRPPASNPGRASVPSPGPNPKPAPAADPDRTTALRPPGLAKKAQQASLVPEPDGTAILPVIPADETPAPPGADSEARKKRAVKRHRGDGGLRTTVRSLGEALITLGAVVLLYAGYEVFGVSEEINNEQEDLSTNLDSIWDEEPEAEGVDGAPVPELGDAFARMWAPD